MTLKNLSTKTWTDNILILGRGYIGSQLFNFLQPLYPTDLKSYSELNYHDSDQLSRYLRDNKISIVINCAGFTGRPNVDECELRKYECKKLNVTVPYMINKLCNELKIIYIHISSGCIYTGYDKEYTEYDDPNFGLFDSSSFYSKTKHAFEFLSSTLTNKIIRIRMPICPTENDRNYLYKLKNYDNLIDYKNSKTYIPELCKFIEKLIENDEVMDLWGQDIYNVVNPSPLSTKEVVDEMISHGYDNPNWNFVNIKDLKILAPRSNCVLDNSKADKIFKLSNELDIIREALKKITL